MARVERVVGAAPAQVFAVLADGWCYASWVVGASRIRDVSADWPAPGAQIHHSIGVWPMLLNDRTEVLDAQDGASLTLRARGWPLGEAHITFTIEQRPAGSLVGMDETSTAGPGHWLVPAALRDRAIRARNRETLRRLAFQAEGRARPVG